MQKIELLARKARRRLILNGLLEVVPKNLLIYLSVAGIAVAISKLWPLGVDGTTWFFSSIAFAVVASVTHSFIWLLGHRPSLMQATMEVDRRYGLKERLSSALTLQSTENDSPLAAALSADASKKADTIDLRDHFPLRVQRAAMWPLLPAACLAIFWFAPNPISESQQPTAQNAQTTANQVKNATNPLLDQLRKKRLEAEEKGLTETAELFKQLESELDELQKKGTLEKSDVLSKLNDLKEKMEERRKEVGAGENLQKNLDKLKDLTDGPAEELAKAMEKGDFDAAKEQVDQLRDKLLNDQLSPDEKQKLAEQMEQMEKAIKEAGEKNAAQKQELEKKLEAAKNAGDSQKAAELQRELDKLESNTAQMDQLQKIAEQLANAKESMQNGQTSEAANQLQQLSEQLQELSEQAQESEQLDEMLEEFEQSKESMKCDECEGGGCSKCQGGNSSSKGGNKSGSKSNSAKAQQSGESKSGEGGKGKGGKGEGQGLGEGEGAGDRPEKENETDTYESQLRDKMQKGETISGGKAGGANKKGISREDVKNAVENPVIEDAEALESEYLPRSRRDQTRDYFKNLREGKSE
jgi:chemotaxis protein histidine kinase CheA